MSELSQVSALSRLSEANLRSKRFVRKASEEEPKEKPTTAETNNQKVSGLLAAKRPGVVNFEYDPGGTVRFNSDPPEHTLDLFE